MKAGVLALQGCVEPHVAALERLGATVTRVRSPEELLAVDRLIMPGGESTTMLTLLERTELLQPLQNFCRTRPVWGVCAGAILAAREVINPAQPSLGLIDVRATRNFYGSQLDSFKATLAVKGCGDPVEVDFIRAPKLDPLHDAVEVLAAHENQPVLLKQGNVMVSSFHTELSTDDRIHELFLELA